MATASSTDELIAQVRQRLPELQALRGSMDALGDKVPDFEAQFPGATAAARSMAETMTGLLDDLPSPAEVRRLTTAFVEEVAPPVDAAEFRAELETLTANLIDVVDALAEGIPEAPTLDTERLASLSGDALGKIPDPVVAHIGGLVKALDLPAIAAKAQELVALADEVRDGLPDEAGTRQERLENQKRRLTAIRKTVIWIRAALQIAAECFSWLEISFPFHAEGNLFVVVKIDLGEAFGATTSQLVLFHVSLILVTLRSEFLLLLIEQRLETLEKEIQP